jgi:nucleotide-binding universal stress UspA family protein
MYKTVLVPIDLAHPEKSKPMIEIARKIGDKDARIILMNVVEEIPGYVALELPESVFVDAHKHAGEKLKSIANAAGIKPDYEVRTGHAHSSILQVAEDQNVDLIIVGSHKPGLQDFFLGSTAARVVRHANCTVLVVR